MERCVSVQLDRILESRDIMLQHDWLMVFIRVGRDFPKWWNRLVSLGLRTPLGKVTFMQNFRPLGCVTAVRRTFIVFAKRYIRSKFQSCQNQLKLKIQSLLTLLITKTPRLSILTNKCGFY